MFFKRLSRSRTNSYVEDDYERRPTSQGNHNGFDSNRDLSNTNKNFDDTRGAYDSTGPPSSYKSAPNFQSTPGAQVLDGEDADQRMYPSRPQDRGDAYMSSNGNGTRPTPTNGIGSRGHSYNDVPMTASSSTKMEHVSAPDLLTRAFTEAVRPYVDKIESLEQQIAELQAWNDQLEQQRQDMHSWIDKRGLRPDVPLGIAKHMDANSEAANSLSAQLDRKITIVNFDLHRLQDDLNDSISSAHFAAAMSKFIPDIQRLAHLPSGPRYAYELVIKVVGNLNSHGGIESTSAVNGDGIGIDNDEEVEEDRRARAQFYIRMDNELVEVIKRRMAEGEDWPIMREVKRLEKTGAYLKNLGIEPYFPRSLDLMRQEAEFRNQNTPPRYS